MRERNVIAEEDQSTPEKQVEEFCPQAGKLIVVGLGNPGPRYQGTPHNVGFCVVELLAERWSIGLRASRQVEALAGSGIVECCELHLLKPLTYMNLSGQSVVSAANFYRIQKENLIIIHDELDLPFGTIRIKKGGGSGGHKGIDSVKQHIGDDFIRIRLGIGRPQSPPEADGTSSEKSVNISDFVLDNFNQKDKEILTDVIDRSEKAVKCVIRRGVSAAMNEFNKRGGERDES